MSSQLVESLHLTFLNAYKVLDYPHLESQIPKPLKHFRSFHTPAECYDYNRPDQVSKRRYYVRGLGELAAIFRWKDLRRKNFPHKDPVWDSIWSLYLNSWSGKPTILPSVPCVIGHLPSKRRTYKLDLSHLPSSLSTASKALSRLGISTFYFPLGHAVSCVSVYLKSEGRTMDPSDLRALNRSMDRFEVEISSEGKRTMSGTLYDVVQTIQERLAEGICGSKGPASIPKKYLIVDLTEGQTGVPDSQVLRSLLTVLQDTGAPAEAIRYSEIKDRLAGEKGGEDALVVCGSTASVLQTHSDSILNRRIRFRTTLRNLAMIVMIQEAVASQAGGLAQKNASEALWSKNVFHQLVQGLKPGDYTFPLTVLHYLGMQAALSDDKSKNDAYENIKQAIDRQKIIDHSLEGVQGYMKDLADRLSTSSKTASDAIHAVLQYVPKIIGAG